MERQKIHWLSSLCRTCPCFPAVCRGAFFSEEHSGREIFVSAWKLDHYWWRCSFCSGFSICIALSRPLSPPCFILRFFHSAPLRSATAVNLISAETEAQKCYFIYSGQEKGLGPRSLSWSSQSLSFDQLLTLGDHNPTVYQPPGHYPWAGDLFSLLEYFLSPPLFGGAVAEAFTGNGSTQKKHQYLLTSLPGMWPLNERNWNMRNEALNRDKDSRNAGTIQACFGGRRTRGRVWGSIFF